MEKKLLQELQKLASQSKTFITYKPLDNEIDYRNHSFILEIKDNCFILPTNKDSDPLGWAKKCITKFHDSNTCILIPGIQFDIYGTRRGKGGGWYDRFLSKIPAEWLRIGVANKSQISDTKLSRNNWDEQVDWIIVRDGLVWNVYETHARSK